jgi:hypothetical protein
VIAELKRWPRDWRDALELILNKRNAALRDEVERMRGLLDEALQEVNHWKQVVENERA